MKFQRIIQKNAMLTNLLATVTTFLVTNTTEVATSYDSYEWAPCPEGRIGCLVNHTRGVNPNGKQVTTTISKVTLYLVEVSGKTNEVRQSETISSTTKYFVREWKEVAAPCPHQFRGTSGYRSGSSILPGGRSLRSQLPD